MKCFFPKCLLKCTTVYKVAPVAVELCVCGFQSHVEFIMMVNGIALEKGNRDPKTWPIKCVGVAILVGDAFNFFWELKMQ